MRILRKFKFKCYGAIQFVCIKLSNFFMHRNNEIALRMVRLTKPPGEIEEEFDEAKVLRLLKIKPKNDIFEQAMMGTEDD